MAKVRTTLLFLFGREKQGEFFFLSLFLINSWSTQFLQAETALSIMPTIEHFYNILLYPTPV